MTTPMHPGRWAMAVARRHRVALMATGATEMPSMLDVTISVLILHRKHPDGVDFPWLLSLPDAELVAKVSYIHENIDRRTGEVHGDLFATTLTPDGAMR